MKARRINKTQDCSSTAFQDIDIYLWPFLPSLFCYNKDITNPQTTNDYETAIISSHGSRNRRRHLLALDQHYSDPRGRVIESPLFLSTVSTMMPTGSSNNPHYRLGHR